MSYRIVDLKRENCLCYCSSGDPYVWKHFWTLVSLCDLMYPAPYFMPWRRKWWKIIGRIHGAIVAATIAPTGCGDDRLVYTPYYSPTAAKNGNRSVSATCIGLLSGLQLTRPFSLMTATPCWSYLLLYIFFDCCMRRSHTCGNWISVNWQQTKMPIFLYSWREHSRRLRSQHSTNLLQLGIFSFIGVKELLSFSCTILY